MSSRGKPPPTWLAGLDNILTDDKPTLVVWQAGTVDAAATASSRKISAHSLYDGVEKIQAAGADVVLMNMQYSPRTESMLAFRPMPTSCAGDRRAARRAVVRSAGHHALLE